MKIILLYTIFLKAKYLYQIMRGVEFHNCMLLKVHIYLNSSFIFNQITNWNWPKIRKLNVSFLTICRGTSGIVIVATHVYNPSYDFWTGSILRVREPSELLVMMISLFSESLYIQVRFIFGDKLFSIVALQIIENDSPITGAPSWIIVTIRTGSAMGWRI